MENWAGAMVKVVAVEEMAPLPGGEVPGVKLKVVAGTRQIWGFYYSAGVLTCDFMSLPGRVIQLTKAELRTSTTGKAWLTIKAFVPPALKRVLRCICGVLLWSQTAVSTEVLVPLTAPMALQSALILSESLCLSLVCCRQCGTQVGHYVHATPPQLRHWRQLVQVPLTSFTFEEVTDIPQVLEIAKSQSQAQLAVTLDLAIVREFSLLKTQVANKSRM